ncbi:MAG: hypothetical protein JWM93_1191 [Frankiales bacterium]|nr:hypothetical protein [Frankiales bacterium]
MLDSGVNAATATGKLTDNGRPDPRPLVVQAAALAPSIHNSQPWLFVSRPDGSLDVRLDTTRHLRVIDASGRQMLVSCGAALEFARLAYRVLGYACTLDILPDEFDPGLVATITHAPGEDPTDDELALVTAMDRRHTDRGPYDDCPVQPELLEELRAGAAEHDVWVRHVDLPVDRVVLGAALWDAENLEADNPEYVDELSRWRAQGRRRDGFVAPPAWPANRVSDIPLRNFDGRPSARPPLAESPPDIERDTVVIFGTIDDDARAHIQTGRTVAWVWLHLTAAGLSAQPLGQSLDGASSRRRLASDLRLIGHPQFIMRIGYGHAALASRRRPLADVLAVARGRRPRS